MEQEWHLSSGVMCCRMSSIQDIFEEFGDFINIKVTGQVLKKTFKFHDFDITHCLVQP